MSSRSTPRARAAGRGAVQRAKSGPAPGFAKLERPAGLRDRVYAMVRDHLRHGFIAPDERIQELTLANQLGVSRTPVREALAQLAKEGLVQPARRGFVLPMLGEAEIAAIYDLRRLLEPHAAALAARGASKEGGQRLAAALADSRRAYAAGDAAAFIRANASFRDALLALTGNRFLVQAVALYGDHVIHLRNATLRDGRVRAIVIEGLERIAAAIAAGDGAAAAAAMAWHLDNAERALRDVMGERG